MDAPTLLGCMLSSGRNPPVNASDALLYDTPDLLEDIRVFLIHPVCQVPSVIEDLRGETRVVGNRTQLLIYETETQPVVTMLGCQPSVLTQRSMHHQKSSSDSPFQANTATPGTRRVSTSDVRNNSSTTPTELLFAAHERRKSRAAPDPAVRSQRESSPVSGNA